MKKEIKNLPASVHDRLSRLAKENDQIFQQVFYFYALERFLYRLSNSDYECRFKRGKFRFSLASWQRLGEELVYIVDSHFNLPYPPKKDFNNAMIEGIPNPAKVSSNLFPVSPSLTVYLLSCASCLA